MKLNILFLLFVAFMIICQDNKKEYSNSPGGGTSSGAAQSGGATSTGARSGGGFAGHKYVTAPSLDGLFRDMNPYYGRVHGTFEYISPESWQPMSSCPAQNKASMLNVAGVGRVSGIPHVSTEEVAPCPNEIQSLNLVK